MQKGAMPRAGREYELAVAMDTANLVDLDASLALGRAAARTLGQLSPESANLLNFFAQQEIGRLELDCREENIGSIAVIRHSLTCD